jgi:hypothetical protein
MTHLGMANAVASEPAAALDEKTSLFSTEKLLGEWRETCRTFLSWERERIIVGQPSREERERHRGTLAWLLRMTRMLDSLMSDPEFPDKSAAAQLKSLLFLLDASWKTIYDPLPEADYRKVIAQCFPEH